MCGITGFYDLKNTRSRAEMHAICQAMNKTITHRGPDSADIWQDPDVPLALGHRRLAILDLSAEGHQPKASFSGRYMVVYNGEIYNHLDLRKELEIAGHNFKGRSDTETLLTAIEHWGLNLTLQKIEGMFAFVLWDRKERHLHFIRDRLGKKPLYIGWAGSTLIFGSELKALRAHPDMVPEINEQALNLMLRNGYVQAPHAIYKNIQSLPAGFRLKIDTQNIEAGARLDKMMEPYWHHLRAIETARNTLHTGSDSQIIDEFEALLKTCVSDRMLSDVPLGAFLSGGIDSSSVVALMQELSSRKIKTYAIGFREAGFDEAVYAAKVADHIGTDHHQLYVDALDAMSVIPKLPDMYDEPFADISAIPTYLVAKFARQDVTVALSGDGGDEMLGGYNRHITGPKIWDKTRHIPRPLRHIAAKAITSVSAAHWDKLVRQRPQFGTAIYKAASVMEIDQQEEFFARLTAQWDTLPVANENTPRLLSDQSDWQTGTLSFAEKMMYWDALSYLPNDILTKVDRASMAVSLEARAPLLDRRIYDYVWRLPERFKVRDGQGKWLLRQVLRRYVPDHLFERPKQGFSMPVGTWLRGDLRDWAEDLLDEQQLKEQGYLDTKIIRDVWDEHLAGRGDHAVKLWTVLMFQAWYKRWM